MADHLSTRDPAARSGSDDADSSVESKLSNDRATDAGGSDEHEQPVTSAQSDEPLMRERAADSSPDASGSLSAQDELGEPLLPVDQSERFTTRWREIQTSFVDQPRDAVAEADAFVADLMQRRRASFSYKNPRA